MTANPEPYDLTPADAAEILGVHRDTVQAWSDKGLLPVWWTPGGQRRYRRSDVLALLNVAPLPHEAPK